MQESRCTLIQFEGGDMEIQLGGSAQRMSLLQSAVPTALLGSSADFPEQGPGSFPVLQEVLEFRPVKSWRSGLFPEFKP